MRVLALAAYVAVFLCSGTLMSGCMRTYTINMGEQPPEDAHYVVVQTRKNGKMKVYDCLSYPDDEWKPMCVRAKMRVFARTNGDGPEELVDE